MQETNFFSVLPVGAHHKVPKDFQALFAGLNVLLFGFGQEEIAHCENLLHSVDRNMFGVFHGWKTPNEDSDLLQKREKY